MDMNTSTSPTSHFQTRSALPPMDDGGSLIKCQICGERLKTINQRHLNKHNITFEEYKKRFPNAPLHSADYLKNHSIATKKVMLKEEYKQRLSASAKSQWIQMRDRMREAVRRGVAKRGMKKVCVDCGQTFHANSPHEQYRCPKCYELYRYQYSLEWHRKQYHIWHHILKESMEEFIREHDNSILPFNYIGFINDIGTSGTPAMNLTILPNGRVAAAVYLETGKMPSVKGAKTIQTPITPWRKRLKEGVWQKRLLEKCPDCGMPNMLVYVENPHCWECGGEIEFAPENQIYTVSEFACKKCGLVDMGQHLILKCGKCSSEFRVRESPEGTMEYKRVH